MDSGLRTRGFPYNRGMTVPREAGRNRMGLGVLLAGVRGYTSSGLSSNSLYLYYEFCQRISTSWKTSTLFTILNPSFSNKRILGSFVSEMRVTSRSGLTILVNDGGD